MKYLLVLSWFYSFRLYMHQYIAFSVMIVQIWSAYFPYDIPEFFPPILIPIQSSPALQLPSKIFFLLWLWLHPSWISIICDYTDWSTYWSAKWSHQFICLMHPKHIKMSILNKVYILFHCSTVSNIQRDVECEVLLNDSFFSIWMILQCLCDFFSFFPHNVEIPSNA